MPLVYERAADGVIAADVCSVNGLLRANRMQEGQLGMTGRFLRSRGDGEGSSLTISVRNDRT